MHNNCLPTRSNFKLGPKPHLFSHLHHATELGIEVESFDVQYENRWQGFDQYLLTRFHSNAWSSGKRHLNRLRVRYVRKRIFYRVNVIRLSANVKRFLE